MQEANITLARSKFFCRTLIIGMVIGGVDIIDIVIGGVDIIGMVILIGSVDKNWAQIERGGVFLHF